MKQVTTHRIEDVDAWYHDPLGAWVEQTEQVLLKQTLGLREGETVVDINAGTGRLAHSLAKHTGATVIAVEPSGSLRALGEKRTAGLTVEWREGIPETLPVEDAQVDALLLVAVLEFVRDPEEVLAEARRVIKPGGRLVVGALSALSPWAALYRHLGEQRVGPWAEARLYTEHELSELLNIADADVQRCVYLAPAAQPPYPEADEAGKRAGNKGAFMVARWDKN